MINLFEGISEVEKDKILKILEANVFNFKKDTIILSTLKRENIIVFIEKGYIQIVQNDYNGNQTIMEELKENNLFGTLFSSISSDECDIVTKEDSKIIVIEYQNIMRKRQDNYDFYYQFIQNLLKILSDKINEKNERIEILTKKSIRNKLLEYFKLMSKKNGSRNIYIPMSFTELALYLAIDRSAMSREIKNLKDEGFIEIKGRKITLLY